MQHTRLGLVVALYLAAAISRADTITGRYTTITVDGAMSEWLAGDVFYADAAIGDGAPPSSTYSNIFLANDSDNLYIGLQLKAPGSINSNWTHSIYIDTDNNPATGFNAGWMAGGYDRLVQYGAGGAVYSIYSFSGGTQASWSWDFLGLINYSFNDEIIEWAISRSMLGGSTEARIEFQVGGGSVTIETWANQAEVNARNYAMAPIPEYTLQVVTAHGTSSPADGAYTNTLGDGLNPSVTDPAAANGTQYVATGWTMTGNDPLSGSATEFAMTVTNDAVLTWTWSTNVQFTRSAGANGSVTGDSDGYYAWNSSVTVTAVPTNGYIFAGWSGSVPTGQTNDNPLSLSLDRARSITANFSPDYGRFVTITADGNMGDWQVGDLFYSDDEIGDGLPLNSTYSNIYVANDQTYLYVGLQLKAPSSIYSNWTHEIYIDTDNDPGTGFNAGWMSGGYDRLVQYGVNGTVYSIYSFSGGANQAAWSWDFLGTIGYSYNEENVEWAIPRSELNGATAPKIEFHVVSGSVTVETWAHQTELNAKIYTMALTPSHTVQVVAAHGTASPTAGAHVYAHGTSVDAAITEPAAANGTQYVATGWAMTGNDPLSGSSAGFTMTVTNDATLTWTWSTNVQFTGTAGAHGSISGDGDGYYALNGTVDITATPDAGYLFGGWSGDVPTGQTNDNPLTLTMDRARSITANFRGFNGRYASASLDGDLSEWTADDAFYVDAEIGDGLPLNSCYSTIYAANDVTYLFLGMQLKAPASINSNWVQNLFIDTDMNPATGYNAGWMANGYDRLVQYGANGGVYSVYSFSGGAQSSWSWDFLGTISYAYNGDQIEWAIPRSLLGMAGTQCKMEFEVTEGAVTIETWAHQAELNARVYTMGTPPAQTLDIVTAYGTSQPAAGSYTNAYGTEVENTVVNPSAANGTQFVAIGWTMTGNDPLSGSATNFTMTHTNAAELTWLWQTNVQFTRTAGTGGSISGDASGYYALNSSVDITAVPGGGYLFLEWTGDVPAGHETDNPLNLTMDGPRSVTATFKQDIGRNFTPTIDGSLAEWQAGDVFYTDAEIGDGAPLNSTYSSISVANDADYLYCGLQLKAVSSIFSNWTHEIYIDSDNNPATGFNAGWMAGGYDRLVQYGAGGGVYSVYSFAGGANQAAWSWNFLGTIGYSYNDEYIEWSIARSMLGTGHIMRLEFHVVNGDVTIETWAHQSEASAKSYAFATPNNCPYGYTPSVAAVADHTVFVDNALNFQVTATDPFCVAPTLTAVGLPSGASFNTSPSGDSQVGTFSWTPSAGQEGTYPIRFIATDDEGLSTSRVMRVYVAAAGEQTDGSGVPVSQTNWAVAITNIMVPSSGNITVVWDSVDGIAYDVFYSDNNFGGAMTWTKVVNGTEANGSTEEASVSAAGSQRYIQVTLAGAMPNSNNVWGVIRPTVQPSTFTMLSPPLDGDRKFNGVFGTNLAQALTSGDQVHIYDPSGGGWRTLTLNGSGVWMEGIDPSGYELGPGQGFFVLRTVGSSALPRFSGPVGNSGQATNTIVAGDWNIIGLSQGRQIPITQAFTNLAQGSPTASWDEDSADLVVLQNSDGSWHRIMRAGNGTWFDLSTFGTANVTFTPGQAVYYYRQAGPGTMKVRF